MPTPNLPGTGITWTDALPRTGLGLTLWAGFVEGELMYRITQEKDRVGPRYQVSMLTISPPFHGYMELRHVPLRSLDSEPYTGDGLSFAVDSYNDLTALVSKAEEGGTDED